VHCDVVIVGYRLNAKEPAPKALERILGLFAEDARKLARSFPATVLAAGSQEQAERLMEQLTEAGALVELRASKPMPAPPPREAQPTTRAKATRSNLRASIPQAAAQSSEKVSLDLSPLPASRAQPRHDKGPPPPPAAALYQLGDFGLAGAGGATASPAANGDGAPLHVPPPPGGFLKGAPVASPTAPRTAAARHAHITAGNLDLDLDLSSAPLELDQPLDPRAHGSRPASVQHEDLHSLGERFSDAPAPARGPAVEEQAFRAIQRAPRPADSRRPGAAPKRSPLVQTLRELVPATVLLALLSGGSVAAVGYALDPEDPLAGLTREQASASAAADSPEHERESDSLHPLLRATPAMARAPLAAILRSRIAGVHEVAVHSAGARALGCAVVEQAEGQTEARLAQVRATGREVPIPSDVQGQLLEHERALRDELQRAELSFREICLTL
jgi:hypothetical protein